MPTIESLADLLSILALWVVYRACEGVDSPSVDLLGVLFHRIIANEQSEKTHVGCG